MDDTKETVTSKHSKNEECSEAVAAELRVSSSLSEMEVPALRGGGGCRVPPPTKKLFAIDTYLQRENHFSPMEWHWLHQPHFSPGPCPRLANTK